MVRLSHLLLPCLALCAALATGMPDASLAQDRKFAEMTFQHLPSLPLDVSRVEVVREYVAPGAKPNVDHLFPVPPADAVARWAQDRLKPVGRFRLARVIVKDASVTEVPLQKPGGIKSWFTTEQAERFDATLEVVVEIRSDVGRDAFAAARVKRSQTIEEGASPNQRKELWYTMTERMMGELDKELERSMRQYLAAYMR
jgi:hypothetical protein